LLDDILRNWDQEANSNLISQIKGKMDRSKSFRKRVIYSIYYLKIQQERLEKIVFRLNRRHEECFDKCVHAKNKNDSDRASIYAEECDQVKKIVKVVVYCKLALEQVILRLETVWIFSDLATSMSIPINLLRDVKNRLSCILPSFSSHMGKIASELEEMVEMTGQIASAPSETSNLTEEASAILEQASLVVEARSQEVLPDVPEEQDKELEMI
jgi:division protein CdvB (Snf7/Vps24/ESCRT-III family)